MNVRSFPPEKFRTQYDEEAKQRTTWYYCPQALSEYKLTFLDIAHKQGLLSELAPDPRWSEYASILFSGPQPSTLNFTEQAAFRHYLQCLHRQVDESRRDTFDTTCDYHERSLDKAETLLTRLHAAGVRGQARDFHDAIDVGRAALAVLRKSRGPLLRRKWNQL